MKGRILYMAYQTPPHGGARGIRILNIIKHLTEFGWKVDVITVNITPYFAYYDPDLVTKLPVQASIYRTLPGIFRWFYQRYVKKNNGVLKRVVEGENRRTWLTIIRSNMGRVLGKLAILAIPDVLIEWYPFALAQSTKLIKRNKYDLILSSAWPYTSHLVGHALKKSSGLPLIVEYGDPWAFNILGGKGRLRFWLEHQMESRVLKSADALVVTTEEARDNYLANYPFFEKDKTYVMPSGIDYSDFENLEPQKSEKFRILFTGRMYQTLDIVPLLEALSSINTSTNTEVRNSLEILLLGEIAQEYKDIIGSYNLGEMVIIKDFVPLKEALSLSLGADVLLFLGNKGGLQVPSRLFYYLAANKPILCIKGDDKDPALRFLHGLNRGLIVNNEIEEIGSAIIKLYKLYQAHRLEEDFDLSTLPEISWKNRVRILDTACESAMRK